jgi:glutamate 5-kinase
MATKLQAADTARKAGVDVVIASGHVPEAIQRIVSGESVGTRFPAAASPLEGRKRWIMSGVLPVGRLFVDEGAERALRAGTGSLLTVGIRSVEGSFSRGETVTIVDAEGRELARGLVRYDSEALHHIRGCRSEDIHRILTYTYGPVAVHRNDLILL